MRRAYIKAICRDIDKGDAAIVQAWKRNMLCIPTEFRILNGVDMLRKTAVQLLESIVSNCENLRRTEFQRMFNSYVWFIMLI